MNDDSWWDAKYQKLRRLFSMPILEYQCQDPKCGFRGIGNVLLKKCPKCKGPVVISCDEPAKDSFKEESE